MKFSLCQSWPDACYGCLNTILINSGAISFAAALLISVCVSGSIAAAQSSSVTIPESDFAAPALRGTLSPEPQANPRNHFESTLRAEGMQYVTTLKDSPELTESQYFSANFKYANQNSFVQTGMDITGGTFFTPGNSHLMVQELYVIPQTQKWTGDASLSLGRKKIGWSQMDSAWNLGLWQPHYEIDGLRPELQGLTGAFLDFDQENFGLVAFASPVFIPNMGPTVREVDGGLVPENRWNQAPPQQAGFAKTTSQVHYQLDVPDTGEIVNHGGYALLARVGNTKRGPWMTGSAGYKPVNELLIGHDLRSTIATKSMDVVIRPQVTYHTLSSIDAGYTGEEVGASVSYLHDDPEDVLPLEGWVVQQVEPVTALAAGVYWQIPALKTRAAVLRLDFLRATGGSVVDVGSDGLRDVLSQDGVRLKFAQAVRVRASGEIGRIFRRPFTGEVSWLYDQDQKGSMVNTELQFFPAKSWAVIAGADFLGVDDENTTNDGFLSQYRANDRVYGGMSYVF